MSPLFSLLEFPADDPERARRFWSELLGASFETRAEADGEGWQTRESSAGVRSPRAGPRAW